MLFGTLSENNRSKLNTIVNRGSTVLGVRQTGLNQLCDSRAKRNGVEIVNDLEDSGPLGQRKQATRVNKIH